MACNRAALPATTPALPQRIAALCAAMEAALAEDMGLEVHHANALVESLETAILSRADPGPTRGLAPWQARCVERHVETRLASTIRIQDLARLTRLSPGHFSRGFKIRFGATPRSWINQRRIDRAKLSMLQGQDSLCRIALDCGFSDQAHLTRVFKQTTGVTPGAWRRQRLDAGG